MRAEAFEHVTPGGVSIATPKSGMRWIGRERALNRLRNQAEEEGWTFEQYLEAAEDVGDGHWESYEQVRGRELANCIVVAEPTDPRAATVCFGDGVLCYITGHNFWNGLGRVGARTDSDGMVRVTNEAQTMFLKGLGKIYFVDHNDILMVTAPASELAEASHV